MGISDVAKAVCHVERNLRCLADMPRVATHNIRDFRGAFKKVSTFLFFLPLVFLSLIKFIQGKDPHVQLPTHLSRNSNPTI